MRKTTEARGGAGRGQGRKPLVGGETTVTVSIKMTEAQRAKLQRLGGSLGSSAWVRDRIDKARDPKD